MQVKTFSLGEKVDPENYVTIPNTYINIIANGKRETFFQVRVNKQDFLVLYNTIIQGIIYNVL
jgi:hypothetical protein